MPGTLILAPRAEIARPDRLSPLGRMQARWLSRLLADRAIHAAFLDKSAGAELTRQEIALGRDCLPKAAMADLDYPEDLVDETMSGDVRERISSFHSLRVGSRMSKNETVLIIASQDTVNGYIDHLEYGGGDRVVPKLGAYSVAMYDVFASRRQLAGIEHFEFNPTGG